MATVADGDDIYPPSERCQIAQCGAVQSQKFGQCRLKFSHGQQVVANSMLHMREELVFCRRLPYKLSRVFVVLFYRELVSAINPSELSDMNIKSLLSISAFSLALATSAFAQEEAAPTTGTGATGTGTTAAAGTGAAGTGAAAAGVTGAVGGIATSTLVVGGIVAGTVAAAISSGNGSDGTDATGATDSTSSTGSTN